VVRTTLHVERKRWLLGAGGSAQGLTRKELIAADGQCRGAARRGCLNLQAAFSTPIADVLPLANQDCVLNRLCPNADIALTASSCATSDLHTGQAFNIVSKPPANRTVKKRIGEAGCRYALYRRHILSQPPGLCAPTFPRCRYSTCCTYVLHNQLILERTMPGSAGDESVVPYQQAHRDRTRVRGLRPMYQQHLFQLLLSCLVRVRESSIGR